MDKKLLILKKYKIPIAEDDSFLIKIENFSISEGELLNILQKDSYTKAKHEKFKLKDTSIHFLKDFSEDRPSLRNLENMDCLEGSIYTRTCEIRNNNVNYLILLDIVRVMLESSNYKTRRAILRFINPLDEYYKADKSNSFDVSCLNSIHYMKNSVVLAFRASDVKNELLTDIINIYWWFLKPIYSEKLIDIEIFASTSQNHEYLEDIERKLENALS